MNLTEHFTLEGLSFSATAARRGIDNTPPLLVIGNLRVLAGGLEQVLRVTGHTLQIHDAYRCEALERLLCEKDFEAWCVRHAKTAGDWQEYFAEKAHPQGFAADFTCAAFGTPTEIVRVIRASGIKFDKVIVEGAVNGKGGWVHLSFAPAMRGVAMVATFDEKGIPHYEELKA